MKVCSFSHGLAASAIALAATLGACGTEPVGPADRPPAQQGGELSIGGFKLFQPPENYGYTGPQSASEQALREQARKFDRTVWEGALIGAVLGTAIGAAAGGDAESAAGGAIAGAALGALAGMYIANKQKQYSSREDQLDSMVSDVRASNRETQALIADARAVLAEDKRRLAQVQARYAQGKATETELKQEQGRVWGNRKVAEKAAQGARDQYRLFDRAREDFKRQAPGTGTASLERELTSFRQSIDALDGVAASMAKA